MNEDYHNPIVPSNSLIDHSSYNYQPDSLSIVKPVIIVSTSD